MIRILIASPDKDSLLQFSTGLGKEDVEITWVKGHGEITAMIKKIEFHLLVVDELLSDIKGLESIGKVVMENPFLNTAAISSLSPEDFHEASEGLGVLMQIPVDPGPEDGAELMEHLNKILKLTDR